MEKSHATIEAWMRGYLADLLNIPKTEVSASTPFERFGLDSAAMVAFTSDLSKWVGMELKSDLLFLYPDIDSVARFLGEAQLKPAM